MNERELREHLQKLKHDHRKVIMEQSGSNWQENDPIVDAMTRAKNESENAQNGSAPSPGAPAEAVPTLPPRPEQVVEPELLPALDLAQTMQSPPAIDTNLTASESPSPSETLAAPLANLTAADAASKEPKQDFKPASLNSDFAQRQAVPRAAKPEKSASGDTMSPMMDQLKSASEANKSRSQREEKAFPNFPPGNPFPFLGPMGVGFGQVPSPEPTDGKFNHEDVAMQAHNLVDQADNSITTLIQLLGRFAHIMTKMQGDIDDINEILDRTFGG